MKRLRVELSGSPGSSMLVGEIAEQGRRVFFEYSPVFVDSGLALSPFKLPLGSGLIEHGDRHFGPLPGLFDDSLPDGWGLLLMDRYFRQQGIDPAGVSPLDRLAYLGTHTMGALTYHPSRDYPPDFGLLDLHALGRNAEALIDGRVSDALPELMRAGGSPGGARPKVLVGVYRDRIISGEGDLPPDFEHWIIKFGAKADVGDAGPIEYAYALMAAAAGIDMPPFRLFEVEAQRRYFGVKRFDRLSGNRRLHVHTFGNLIHANFRIPSSDYADLIKVTRVLTRNHADVLRLFRRMVFNVAAHNRDDHAKNFAFLMNSAGEWTLTPAYDLTYSEGPGGEHTMTLLGEGRAPGSDHCLRLAVAAGIKSRQAGDIIDQVNTAISRWPEFAAAAGCSERAKASIATRIRPV